MFSFLEDIRNPQTQVARYAMMVICVVLIVLVLPKGVRFQYEFEKGQLWLHDDLVAPNDFPILKTEQELTRDKAEALSGILPIYRINPSIENLQIESYKREFEREWPVRNRAEASKSNNYQAGLQLLQQAYQRGIITLKRSVNDYKDYSITLVNNNVAEDLNTSVLFTTAKAKKFFEAKLKKYYGIDTELMLFLLENHLQPNIEFDENFTQKLQNEALEQVSAARGMLKKGEVIVYRSNIIDERTYQKLVSLRADFEQKTGHLNHRSYVFAGQFLLIGMVVALLMTFLFLFRRDIYSDSRQLVLILLIVTVMLVVLSWAVKIRINSLYLIPYCITPIIIRILFDTRLALNIHLLVVIVASFFVPNGFEFVFLQITTGMVAIYSLRNLHRRSQFLVSSLLIFGTYCVGYIGINTINSGSLEDIPKDNLMWFATSSLLSLLAYPLIYLFERLFAISSDLTLLELTSANSKLLRELSFKAPGTFQHSLQVANLAEEAIYQIGGNALIVRAGALYHDIGKMKHPEYFIENQLSGQNPHDRLTYQESAQFIIDHVHAGIDLARKNGLPESLIDFIRTHHGTTRSDFFYRSFMKNFPDQHPDESLFRYPGPIPFTKEQAVLMLADSVEAASRSLKEPDEQSINLLVDSIIDYKLEQNQLDNSDISLKDIEAIRKIFKQMLMSIYHVRIMYPEV